MTLSSNLIREVLHTGIHVGIKKNLIGKNHSKDYIESEVKRILNEALLINEAIKGIEDLKCDSNGEKLKISFGLETIYGRGDIDV